MSPIVHEEVFMSSSKSSVCPSRLRIISPSSLFIPKTWMSFNNHLRKKLVWSTRIGRIILIWTQLRYGVETNQYGSMLIVCCPLHFFLVVLRCVRCPFELEKDNSKSFSTSYLSPIRRTDCVKRFDPLPSEMWIYFHCLEPVFPEFLNDRLSFVYYEEIKREILRILM